MFMAHRHAFTMWIGNFYTQKCCFYAVDVWCKWSFMCVFFFLRLNIETEWMREVKREQKRKIHTFIFGDARKKCFFLYELDTYNESNIHTRRWRCWSIFCWCAHTHSFFSFSRLVFSCTLSLRAFFRSVYSACTFISMRLVIFDEENRFGETKKNNFLSVLFPRLFTCNVTLPKNGWMDEKKMNVKIFPSSRLELVS